MRGRRLTHFGQFSLPCLSALCWDLVPGLPQSCCRRQQRPRPVNTSRRSPGRCNVSRTPTIGRLRWQRLTSASFEVNAQRQGEGLPAF